MYFAAALQARFQAICKASLSTTSRHWVAEAKLRGISGTIYIDAYGPQKCLAYTGFFA